MVSKQLFLANKPCQTSRIATFTAKQLTTLSPTITYQVPTGLRQIFTEHKDTEGRIINYDAHYELVNGDIAAAIDYLKLVYPNLSLVPAGGQSAGGGVFVVSKNNENQKIIGLYIPPPPTISGKQYAPFTISNSAPMQAMRTQEIHINRSENIVYAGAGVTLDQLKATVQEALSTNYTVLGTDLTSSGYASCGATFMTGGMGPSRRNFGDSVIAINFYDGESSKYITDKKELSSLVETYGWTGFVQSIAVPIRTLPPYEFGLAVPVNNTPTELAHLVNYFADQTILPSEHILQTQTLITGLEMITGDALQLIYDNSPNMEGLDLLIENYKAAHKNAVVFISGVAPANPFENIEDPLRIFVENARSGLALEQATPFASITAMKIIREGAPDLARRQFMDAPFSYKDHTDINVLVNISNCMESVFKIMLCYHNYKTQLEKLIATEDMLLGNVQVYGHLNPQGFDPHYRITLVSIDAKIMEKAAEKATILYAELVNKLQTACTETGSTISGGEKGIISNQKILNALTSSNNNLPRALQRCLQKQKSTIAKANPMFNWRSKINLAR